jgi:hypothetical protein
LSGNNLVTNVKVEITLNYDDTIAAEAIRDAISPENQETQVGTTVETNLEGSTLIINVKSDKKIKTLIATIDDLLSCIQAAERAINEIE